MYMEYLTRKATFADGAQIMALYQEVAKHSSGLAVRAEEIDQLMIGLDEVVH